MRVIQSLWTSGYGWNGPANAPADLVLAFGATSAITDASLWRETIARHPNAIVLGCSTGGEIHGTDVLDGSLSVTALSFDRTALKCAEALVEKAADSFDAGHAIGQALAGSSLRTIFLLSDGTRVNGSKLLNGLRAGASAGAGDVNVVITGGLAADGPRFGTTYVALNGQPAAGRVAAIGFYGTHFQVGHGCAGGWDVFGPERHITRSEGNALFELDGKPALDLYKRYLGEDADGLPGSALLFPLKVFPRDRRDQALTRTIVGIDEERHAMIFAGDVPEGHSAQLMRGNFDRLVEGAADAASQAARGLSGECVGVLVSCIGRKLLLGQRICEEVEAVHQALGADTALTGFYSYGEVSPHAATNCAKLHNQTMTVTVIGENADA